MASCTGTSSQTSEWVGLCAGPKALWGTWQCSAPGVYRGELILIRYLLFAEERLHLWGTSYAQGIETCTLQDLICEERGCAWFEHLLLVQARDPWNAYFILAPSKHLLHARFSVGDWETQGVIPHAL